MTTPGHSDDGHCSRGILGAIAVLSSSDYLNYELHGYNYRCYHAVMASTTRQQ